MEATLDVEGVREALDTDFVSSAESYNEDELSDSSKQRRTEQGVGQGGTWALVRKKWRRKEVSV